MALSFFSLKKSSFLLILGAVCAFLGMVAAESLAVTRFSPDHASKVLPAGFNLNDIWFYNTHRDKAVPDIDLYWMAVVFRAVADDEDGLSPDAPMQATVEARAGELLDLVDDLTDYYYDKNLAEDACFFSIRPNMTIEGLSSLMTRLNEHDSVAYAHPVLKIEDRRLAFFNAFTLIWKASAGEAEKTAILNQFPVYFDDDDQVFRVDITQKPFFHVVNLLAEDVHVLEAAPCLVGIQPSIQGDLTLEIAGGNIGDRIPFLLRIAFSPRVTLDPSSLATINLRPENIQKELIEISFDPFDYTKAVLNSPVLITGQIKFYAPGDYDIPAVDIKYHCAECSQPQDRSFQTKPVPVKIASIVPESQKDSSLIVLEEPPLLRLPIESIHQSAMIHLAIAAVCLALIIGGAAWFWLRWASLKKGKERLGLEGRKDMPSERMRLLLDRPSTGDPLKLVAEVNALFRDHLTCRYQIPSAPAGGSGTVFWEAIQHHLPLEVGAKAKSILEAIDRMAATELTDEGEMEKIRKTVMEVLDRSKTPSGNE